MSTKMKTLEEQHQDYQKHIAVLKESLCAKEEHYTMLQTDVSSVHIQANRKVQYVIKIQSKTYPSHPPDTKYCTASFLKHKIIQTWQNLLHTLKRFAFSTSKVVQVLLKLKSAFTCPASIDTWDHSSITLSILGSFLTPAPINYVVIVFCL